MLKYVVAFSALASTATPAFADPHWYMVRSLEGVTSVVGTYADEASCEASIAYLAKAYDKDSRARVAGRKFGDRSCSTKWPE